MYEPLYQITRIFFILYHEQECNTQKWQTECTLYNISDRQCINEGLYLRRSECHCQLIDAHFIPDSHISRQNYQLHGWKLGSSQKHIESLKVTGGRHQHSATCRDDVRASKRLIRKVHNVGCPVDVNNLKVTLYHKPRCRSVIKHLIKALRDLSEAKV